MNRLLAQLKEGRILLADGAMGTSLQSRGLTPGACPELWNIDHPETVESIIAGYLAAGSDIVETNSFGGSRCKLAKFGLAEQTDQINTAAARVARRAVESGGGGQFVFGSVGPTGEFIEPLGTLSEQDAYDAFKQQAIALEDGGADAICIETMTALEEAKGATAAAKENTSLPVIVSFTFEKSAGGDYRTMMGVSIGQIAAEMPTAGADIIGSNCGTGPEDMIAICRQFGERTDCFVMVQPNAGLPVLEDGKTVFKATAAEMADGVEQLIAAGANIIGGCCGTTTEHILAMRAAIDRLGR